MPPPQQAITTKPASSSARIAPASTMRRGRGEATTRRYPRPASSTMTQWSRAWWPRASSAEKNGPMGLLGRAHAGSSASTTVWVSRQVTRSGWPRRPSSLASEFPMM
jgi:hypothetical protein